MRKNRMNWLLIIDAELEILLTLGPDVPIWNKFILIIQDFIANTCMRKPTSSRISFDSDIALEKTSPTWVCPCSTSLNRLRRALWATIWGTSGRYGGDIICIRWAHIIYICLVHTAIAFYMLESNEEDQQNKGNFRWHGRF